MTYCLAIALDAGLVFAADSRTNAGVDYVTTYSKMHVFEAAPDRVFVLLSAGNLATTQEVGQWLRRDLETGAAELFDLDADVGETTDLAANEPERAEELLRALRAWRALRSAPLPTMKE